MCRRRLATSVSQQRNNAYASRAALSATACTSGQWHHKAQWHNCTSTTYGMCSMLARGARRRPRRRDAHTIQLSTQLGHRPEPHAPTHTSPSSHWLRAVPRSSESPPAPHAYVRVHTALAAAQSPRPQTPPSCAKLPSGLAFGTGPRRWPPAPAVQLSPPCLLLPPPPPSSLLLLRQKSH